jgi:hypothetical protein
MTRRIPIAALLASALFAAGGALAQAASAPAGAAAPPATPQSLERAAFLAGCWRSDAAEAGSGEQWLPLAGNTLLGVSRTIRRGETVAHEFMQIRQLADGSVAYVAQPSGQAETSFVLQPGGVHELVFENPGHDFPQRVIYRLAGPGQLRARIEGMRGGQLRGIDFPMTRVACDAQPALPDAFQGLPWGAPESQIRMRFGPAALKLAECTARGAAQRQGTRPGEACNHPVVTPYEVAGIPFRLNLHVDERARQLVRVSLAYGGEPPAESHWADKHRTMRGLLAQRYGNPEFTHVDGGPGPQSATARWRRGDTLIELQSTFLPRTGQQPAREHIEITYQPVHAGDAGKL